jgi:hypothetical protein
VYQPPAEVPWFPNVPYIPDPWMPPPTILVVSEPAGYKSPRILELELDLPSLLLFAGWPILQSYTRCQVPMFPPFPLTSTSDPTVREEQFKGPSQAPIVDCAEGRQT